MARRAGLAYLPAEVMGVPLSWKKLSAGMAVSWIGLEVDLRAWQLGLSERRAAWADRWFETLLAEKKANVTDMRQTVGRLQFAYEVLAWDRPFLSALYAWMGLNVHRPDASLSLPQYVLAVVKWLRDRLRQRRIVPCGRLLADGLPSSEWTPRPMVGTSS